MIAELTKKDPSSSLKETATLAGVEVQLLTSVSLAAEGGVARGHGGDGTILRVVHELGANIGRSWESILARLGFLPVLA